jgi:Holliday junction resolvase RusA-like endonuclease
MDSKFKYVFLDAMIFLHFKPLEQIDWPTLLNSTPVRLVLTRITIREIDKHKSVHPSPKIKDRARRILKKLETFSKSPDMPIREGVEITFYDEMPSLDYPSYGLNPDWSDDIFIATIITYGQKWDRNSIVLVTDDTGVRIKAKSLNIETFELPDDLRLPIDPDPLVEENRKLREKLTIISATLPELHLYYDNGESFKKFEFDTKADETVEKRASRITAEVEKERKKREYNPNVLLRVSTMYSPSQQEIERFKKDLDEYLKQYESYLNDLSDWKLSKSKIFALEFNVVNEGNAPAEDIDILIYFPDGFLIRKEDDLPAIPKQPKEPIPPKSTLELIQSRFDIMRNFSLPSYDQSILSSLSRNVPRDVSGPKIKRTKSYEVEYHISRLKHGFSIKLDAVYLDFSESVGIKSFETKYWINARNMPESAEGSLHIVFESKTL